MGALLDAILTQTDPVTALILVGIGGYIRAIREDIKSELSRLRTRMRRLENNYITDGGEPDK